MKIKKFKYIVIILGTISIYVSKSYAQTTYSYDNSGNRTQGTIFISPAQRIMSPMAAINKDLPKADEYAMQKAMTLGISVYPTMVNEFINITIGVANEYAPALVEIYDNLGRTILTKRIENYNQDQINLSTFKDGLYNLSIKIKGQQLFYKVIKGK